MPVWIPWSVVFLALAGFFTWQMVGRMRLLFSLRRDDFRDYGPKTWGTRAKLAAIYAFGQWKFLHNPREVLAGIMHVVIFWGFLMLGIQVVHMFVRGWFPAFHLPLVGDGILGGPYAALKDLFQVLVLFAVTAAIVRWSGTRPERLLGFLPAEARLRKQKHHEALVILVFIATIMTTGFLYDGARIILQPYDAAIQNELHWQPVTRLVARLISGLSPDGLDLVAQISWWTHNCVVLVFLNLLPRSKHFHIITAIPNTFFGKVEPIGRLAKKNYEAEGAIFGRSTTDQFTWKQQLDMFSCTECGRCSSVCPATATGKPLAPRQFLLNLRDAVYADQQKIIAAYAGGKKPAEPVGQVIIGDDKAVIDEVVWSCVSCRACEEACPVNIEYVDKIVDIRQHLVQEAARFPEEMNRTFRGLENNSNPWAISPDERADWAQGLDVPLISEMKAAGKTPEWLYYVGCAGSFDQKHRKATQSFIKILKAANVDFAIMGKEEKCNGETARRLGNEYLYQTMAQSLAEQINGYGVKKILVNCPHCFNTMKNEYPEFGGHWEIVAAGEYTKKLVAEQKVRIGKDFRKKVVYHDSCYYGRYNDLYEPPRDLIKAVPGAELTEMDKNKKQGTCCGAGGGRMWLEERKDQRVNVMRTEQALAKNPDVIAVSCPFCRVMMSSGVNEKGLADKVEVMDVMEVVAANLEEKAPV